MSPDFVPGKVLSRRFYHEVVGPLVRRRFPGLPHTAGLVDYGSDVLGYDDAMSRDHQWGPRLSVFLTASDLATYGPALDQELSGNLPREFLGYSTHFSDPGIDPIRRMESSSRGPVGHLVRIHSPGQFFLQHLGWDPSTPPTVDHWLHFPQQRLLTLARGELFHDDLNLQGTREALAWYPKDGWVALMAVQWQKIAEEEAFVGRTAGRGDELGSRLVAARMVERMMRLSFLQRRTYFPYAKWFGTAFRGLEGIGELELTLQRVVRARTGTSRQRYLGRAYQLLGARQNALGLGPPVDLSLSPYYARPFPVIFAGRFADALGGQIEDPGWRLSTKLGCLDQVTDQVALLENPPLARERIALVPPKQGELRDRPV